MAKVEFLPDGFSNWSNQQLKKLKKRFIEFVTFLYNGSEVESAKSFACYSDGLQRGFKMIYKFNIKIRNGDVFNEPETVLFHAVDNICKNMQADGK